MKKIDIISFILLLIFIVSNIIGCSNNDYVIKVNDEKVSENEFLIYLNEAKINFETLGGIDIWKTDFEGLTAEEVAKNSALNAVEVVKVSKQKARELNITLNDDELEKANKDAEEKYKLLKNLNNDITLNEVKLVITDQLLYNKLYNSVVSNFEISEVDFNSYYEDVYNEFYNNYKKYSVKSIFFNNYSDAEDFIEEYQLNSDFDLLFEKYINNVENSIKTVYKKDLEGFFGLTFDTNIGDITSILSSDDGYYILKVENILNPTEEEIREITKKVYSTNKQNQFFNEEYKKWYENIKIDKNDELLENIKIFE